MRGGGVSRYVGQADRGKKRMTQRYRIVLALAFSIAPVYAQQPLNPPLKNWAAPLYWAPTPREAEQQRLEQRIAHPEASSSAIAQAASIFTGPGPMTFIAVTPCRVMDTRSTQPFTGAFGPPSLVANVARQVPMPTSTTCSIPATAGAYSLNVTAVPPGPLSFLSVWPAGQPFPTVSTLNDPVAGGFIANAAIVVAGTAGAIQMFASNPTDVIIDINGYYAAPTDDLTNTALGTGALSSNTTGTGDSASGYYALASNSTGFANTASGNYALQFNTTGAENTASGYGALQNNNDGAANTATGVQALQSNTHGAENTAVGFRALQDDIDGSGNTAYGDDALASNTHGYQNIAVGDGALQSLTTGCCNIAIGGEAGINLTGANAYNIDIGSEGAPGDVDVIRIGTPGPAGQNFFFAAGINGVNVSGAPVVVNSSGQLGVVLSSRRFKEDIKDMGDASSGLLRLRPVTFRYKQPYDDGSKPIDYGLIAEEVAQVYPELAVTGVDGRVETIQYQKLTPMLLNEVQKQAEQIRALAEQNRLMGERLAALEASISPAREPAH
jgi:hypothetical protein